jgi:hypothetical protein
LTPGALAAPEGAEGLLFNAMNVVPEAEAVFNAWYDEEHLPALARVPGTLAARRYRSAEAGSGSHRYLALYHLESPAVTQSAAWKAAVDTPWSKRVRPHFRDRIRIEARRYVRRMNTDKERVKPWNKQTFYSEVQTRVIFTCPGLRPKERRAVSCLRLYTGVKDLYLPDNARVLNEAGYAVPTFDYAGWGASEGSRSRLAPYSRVADVQAALTFRLAANVDPERLALRTSYGSATVAGGRRRSAHQCIVSVVGIAWAALDAQRAPAGRVARSSGSRQGRPGEARARWPISHGRSVADSVARPAVGGVGGGRAARESCRRQ